MEYRKRTKPGRKRNRARSAPKRESGGTGGRLILTLILLGGAVYLISASAAGTWMAKNVMAPIFDAFSKDTGKSNTVPVFSTNTGEEGSKGSDTEEVKLSGMHVYVLQMGVYRSEDGARETADAYKKRGAGGYIMKDGDEYRVMASAYSDKDEARIVRDRLSKDGIDTAIHEISLGSISFSVTAQSTVCDTVSRAFSSLSSAVADMIDLSQEFDRDSMTVSAGRDRLNEILNDITQNKKALSDMDASDAVMGAVLNCMQKYADALKAVSGYSGDNTVDFSSDIKYTLINMIDEYSLLINSLSL